MLFNPFSYSSCRTTLPPLHHTTCLNISSSDAGACFHALFLFQRLRLLPPLCYTSASITLPDSFIYYKFFLSQSHFHFRFRIVNPYPLNPHTALSFQGRRREKEKRRRKGRRLLLKNITPLILKGCHSNYSLHLKARKEAGREAALK